MIKRTSLKLNNTSESIHTSNGSCSSDLCTETVSTNSCHSDLVLVHESNNIFSDIIHVIGTVMVGVTLVSVVKKPNITNISHFIVLAHKELLEVVC